MIKIIGLKPNPLAAVWWSTIDSVERNKWLVACGSRKIVDAFEYRLQSIEGFNTEMSEKSIIALEAAQS